MMRLFVFLLILTQTHGDYPALKIQLLQKSLTEGSQMMSVWIQQKLKSTEIPDVHGNVDIGIGTIDFTLSNDDGGSFDLAVYNININLLLLFSDDESGRPLISTGSCTDAVGGVDVEFHGGASILFQPFVSFFRGQIADMIHEQICPAVTQVIDDVEMHLQEIPVNLVVNQYIYLSIPLTSSPFVTNDNVQLDMKGEFYSRNSPSEPPFSAQDFDLQYTDDYMISLGLSEFFINSAAYSYFSSGLLQINIKDDMIPESSPIHLNTSQFSIFIPQDSFFSGNAQIENEHLTGAFKMSNLTLNLGSSEIGDFKTAPLEQAIKIAMNMFVLPKLNEKLKVGFALPVLRDFSLINTNMLIKNGFVIILTDVEATPSNLSILF